MRFFKLNILVFSLICLATSVKASHIVGGEFELIHISEYKYKLRLILYSDDINIIDPAAIDNEANVHFWSKKGDKFIRSVLLPLVRRTKVPYTNPACVIPELSTSKIVYEREIILEPTVFNDPEGYYINYERCCRNDVILNIRTPGAVGQAFYLEFPPVIKGGEQFVNSSPSLFPPLSDFARVGYPFYFDFRGTDADGDSLVYSLATPLAGSSSPDPGNILPPPRSAPYAKVTWRAGYSDQAMVPGTPPLQIENNGMLRVTPTQQGLYVFSVQCDEYRNGKKIGEVRRDFQMLVYNYQGDEVPPRLVASKPGSSQEYEGTLNVVESDFTGIEQRCIRIKVTDADINKPGSGFSTEKLSFNLMPVNFSGNIQDYLSVSSGFVNTNEPVFNLDLCLPQCPPKFNEPYIMNLVAYDDACALPLSDTLRIVVDVNPPPNDPAFFKDLKTQSPTRDGVFSNPVVEVGEVVSLLINGFDKDGDKLVMNAQGVDFDLATYGFKVEQVSDQVDGNNQRNVQYKLTWNADCEKYNPNGRNYFQVKMMLDDENSCDNNPAAFMKLDFKINIPENNKPETITTLSDSKEDVTVVHEVGKVISFKVKGNDKDFDKVTLKAVGDGFDLEDYGIQFAEKAGVGAVQSDFVWEVKCSNVNLSIKNLFKIHFITTDLGNCNAQSGDTITVNIGLKPPPNNAPIISLAELASDEIEIMFDSLLTLNVIGFDEDNDPVELTLDSIKSNTSNVSYSWKDAQGQGSVSSVLLFKPECELFQGGLTENVVEFTFRVKDAACASSKADVVTVKVKVKDKPMGMENVFFPNVFTPNGDDVNQYFEIHDLPEGSCANQFEFVRVFNRWGRVVAAFNERNFKWDGEDNPPGVYYYVVQYSNYSHKSSLTILKPDL